MNEWTLTPDRYLAKEEVGKLLRRAEELRTAGVAEGRRQAVRDWLIIRLALFSGLRASEICDLAVTDCHSGTATVRSTGFTTLATPPPHCCMRPARICGWCRNNWGTVARRLPPCMPMSAMKKPVREWPRWNNWPRGP